MIGLTYRPDPTTVLESTLQSADIHTTLPTASECRCKRGASGTTPPSVPLAERKPRNTCLLHPGIERRQLAAGERLPLLELLDQAAMQIGVHLLLRRCRSDVVRVDGGNEGVVLLVEAVRITQIVLRCLHVDLDELLLDRFHVLVEIPGGRQERLAASLATRPGLQRLEIAPQGAHLIDGAVQRVGILCLTSHHIPVR